MKRVFNCYWLILFIKSWIVSVLFYFIPIFLKTCYFIFHISINKLKYKTTKCEFYSLFYWPKMVLEIIRRSQKEYTLNMISKSIQLLINRSGSISLDLAGSKHKITVLKSQRNMTKLKPKKSTDAMAGSTRILIDNHGQAAPCCLFL